MASSGRFWIGDRPYQRGGRPYIMGVLNVTPDSFSDGGRYFNPQAALARALAMVEEGAHFIDIGGESSRPGAIPITAEDEIARVLPVIEELASRATVPLSIDTTKAAVAERALTGGAAIVNDISALRFDADMAHVIKEAGATVVLMHMQGDPRTMQKNPQYNNVVGEIHGFLQERRDFAISQGIAADHIILDPGLGFGKRLGGNYEILRRLGEFSDLGTILIGPSRKSFIGTILNVPAADRLFGTAGAVAMAAVQGADIIRVHDVKEMKQVVQIVYECMTRCETPSAKSD